MQNTNSQTISGRLAHHRSNMGAISVSVTFVDRAELDENAYGFEVSISVAEPRPEHIAAHRTVTRLDADAVIAAIEGWAPLTAWQKTAIRDLDWR